MTPSSTPEGTLAAYGAALATQDWAQVAPLFHEDAVVTFSSGASFRGKDDIGAAFSRNFAAIADEEYALSDVEWVERPACHAVCTYRFAWSGVVDGRRTSGGGRATSVLRRDGETWLVLVEHLGPGPD